MSRDIAWVAFVGWLVVACAQPTVIGVDMTLPEAVSETSTDPQAVLEAAAARMDPTERAAGLVALVRLEKPVGGPWARRALADPHPWVQRQVVSVLMDRTGAEVVLKEFVSRDIADPYVRSRVVVAMGDVASLGAVDEAWRTATVLWKAAPLALAAAMAGDRDAQQIVLRAARQGELDGDVQFLDALGRSGVPGIQLAITEGLEWVEPSLIVPFAVALSGAGAEDEALARVRTYLNSPEPDGLGTIEILLTTEVAWADGALDRMDGGTGSVPMAAKMARNALRGKLSEDSFTHGDAGIREMSFRVLPVALAHGAQGGRTWIPVLERGLVDGSSRVRLAAIQAAIPLDLPLARTLLKARLDDDIAVVRVHAAELLLK